MKKWIILFLSFCFILTSLKSPCQINYRGKVKALMTAFSKSMLPSDAVILIGDKNNDIVKITSGYSNYEFKTPLQINTKFRIASISKQFTAVCGLLLARKGIIDLYVAIENYLPELSNTEVGKVTIYELLTNTSGIKNDRFIWDYVNFKTLSPMSNKAFIDSLKTEKLEFQAGTKMNYSNTGFVLACVIMEKVTGKRYEDILNELIFSPLKMYNSGLDRWDSIIVNKAYGYDRTILGDIPCQPRNLFQIRGAGAMYSNVDDLSKWLRKLFLSNDLLEEKERAILTHRFTGPYVRNIYTGRYAMGIINDSLEISGNKKVSFIWHDGILSGNYAITAYLPEKQMYFIVLTNHGFNFNPITSIVKAIVSIIYGKSYTTPKISFCFSLVNHLHNGNKKINILSFGRSLMKDSVKYDIKENDINDLGYLLLEKKNIVQALDVFILNTELFPISSDAFNSLAEGYLSNGDKKNAVRCFKKSLQLNPKNKESKQALENLEK